MILQDGINFAEDVEALQQLYGLGDTEEFFALDQMSGYAKQPVGMGLANMSYQQHQSDVLQQYTQTQSQHHMVNQHDLVAMPNGLPIEYDDSSSFTTGLSSDYQQPHITMSTPAVGATYAYSRPQELSRKRKASAESLRQEGPAPKRVALALQDPNGDYHDLSNGASPYSSLVPTPVTVHSTSGAHLSGSPRTAGHHYSTSNASCVSIAVPSPYTPIVSPAFTTANTEQSPRAPSTPAPRPASTVESTGSNPKLVRTSTMPQQSSPPIGPGIMPGQTQAFNPYTLYSPDSKARLHLKGNLDNVAKDWSEEELEARRKIIIFNREQKGNDIYADFKVVTQSEWKNHPRTVNCIWWAEKKEAYVTSVDTILLLESLVAARFTVEEKNRIRRNLEGFKPLTVSKAKADSEEFFKVIMGFSNPKPRNIEKDVKVFPWKVLSVALQKIISKYSASYASTASSIANVGPKPYRPETFDFHYPVSPAQDYCAEMVYPAYAQYNEVAHMGNQMVVPHTSMPSGSGVRAVHMSQEMPQHYGYVPVSVAHSAPQYQQQVMQAPVSTGYWNHHGYPQEAGMHMATGRGHMPTYSREMIEAAEYAPMPVAAHMTHR